jgi:hypothetical protein
MNGESDQAGNPIVDRLGEAIEQLQKNVKQVEIWAGALRAYAQPVASYPIERHRLSRVNSGRGADPTGRETQIQKVRSNRAAAY